MITIMMNDGAHDDIDFSKMMRDSHEDDHNDVCDDHFDVTMTMTIFVINIMTID